MLAPPLKSHARSLTPQRVNYALSIVPCQRGGLGRVGYLTQMKAIWTPEHNPCSGACIVVSCAPSGVLSVPRRGPLSSWRIKNNPRGPSRPLRVQRRICSLSDSERKDLGCPRTCQKQRLTGTIPSRCRYPSLLLHKDDRMFLRIDRLQTELPLPKAPNPNQAAALQELLGGKYGEMSTLGNYMFQSFNFRNKSKLRPFYSLVANITSEELGHVELVSTGVSLLNNGPGDPERSERGHQRSALRGHGGHPPCGVLSFERWRRHADEQQRRILEHGFRDDNGQRHLRSIA